MYICIDESGVQSLKHNRYFIIGGFICKDITKIRSIHKKIEKEIKLQNCQLVNKIELKASVLDAEEKAKFINKILEIDGVFIFSICYDLKNNALMKKLKSNEDKFNFLVKLTLDNLFKEISDPKYQNKYDYIKNGKLEIRLDNRNVKNSYNDKLEDYLVKQSHFSYEYNIDIIKCSYHDSKKWREIQMADYIANIFWTIKNYPQTELVVQHIPNWNKSSFLWEYSKNVIIMDKPNFKINLNNIVIHYSNSFQLILRIDFAKIGMNKKEIIKIFENYQNKYLKISIKPNIKCLIIKGIKSKIQNMLDDLKIDINIHELINS